MIKVGGTEITDVMLGSTQVNKVYLGSSLIWEKNTLPYDARVEYLEGGTTQYIDTGVQPNLNMRSILVASSMQGASGAVFGARVALNNSMYALMCPGGNNSNKVRFDYASATHLVTGYLNDKHIYGLFGDQRMGVIDNTKVCDCAGTTLSCSYSIHLFGINDGGVHTNRKSNCRIYSFSLWNSGTKFMNLIPVRIGQVGYMYDTLGEQLYGNSGTGSFTLGADIT